MTTDTVFSLTEVAKHNHENSLWLIVHGNVYDVTKYANEHPGGLGVLLEHTGIDATDDFEDVGHSSDAREIMAPMKIGIIESVEKTAGDCGCAWKRPLLMLPVVAVAVAGLAVLVYKLTRRVT